MKWHVVTVGASIAMRSYEDYNRAMACFEAHADSHPQTMLCLLKTLEDGFNRCVFQYNYNGREREVMENGSSRFHYKFGQPMPYNADTIRLFLFTKAVEAIAMEAMQLPEPVIRFQLPVSP